MAQTDNILQELRELESILANASAVNVYAVPVGYFEGLADKILNQIKATEAANSREEMKFLSPVISNIPVTNPYSLPDGYFEKLQDNLSAIVRNTEKEQTPQEELEELSPLLSSLKKEVPYKIPAGYFDQVNIPGNKKAETKVISISSRKWFRYAAAAVTIAFIATMGLLFSGKNETIDPAEKSFAWVERSMKKVSTNEIDEFVEMADKMAPVIASNTEKADVQELIRNIPDKEIQDFLNDTKAAEPDGINADDIFN